MSFRDITFALVGVLPSGTHKEVADRVRRLGGHVVGTLSLHVNALVRGRYAEGERKLKDAERWGIKIIDESQMWDMLEANLVRDSNKLTSTESNKERAKRATARTIVKERLFPPISSSSSLRRISVAKGRANRVLARANIKRKLFPTIQLHTTSRKTSAPTTRSPRKLRTRSNILMRRSV